MFIFAMLYILYTLPGYSAPIEDKITGIIKVEKVEKDYVVSFSDIGIEEIKDICKEVVQEEINLPPAPSIETIRSGSSHRSFLDLLIAF